MFTIKLVKGDNLWSEQGIHICDDNGFVSIVEDELTLQIQDEVTYNHIKTILTEERSKRGLDENGETISIQSNQTEFNKEVYEKTQNQIQVLTSEINDLKTLILQLSSTLTQNSTTEQPTEQPAEQPVEQPVEQPIEQLAEQPAEQPAE